VLEVGQSIGAGCDWDTITITARSFARVRLYIYITKMYGTMSIKWYQTLHSEVLLEKLTVPELV
jgi:hypothetical protein